MSTQITLSRKQTIEQSAGQQAALALAGLAANKAAAGNAFDRYREDLADGSKRAQASDLQSFAEYLAAAGVRTSGERLYSEPAAWQGMSWGLVEGFVRWLLQRGDAISTLNRRLSTVKSHAKIAAQAGFIGEHELALIQIVKGKSGKAGKRVDAKREVTRLSTKKSEAVQITLEQAEQLKDQPSTPQGRRDALLMALLLDHGMRAGEVALLKVGNFDLPAGMVRFYRPKVDNIGNHKLTADTLRAVQNWQVSGDCPAMGEVLRGSIKGGALAEQGMSERAITERVRVLGEQIGLSGLSAHDCRHYAATDMAGKGYNLKELMDWFGWSSPATAMRYVESTKVQERYKG